MSELRLLKVMVQPIFVIDDGQALTEEAGQVITVNSGDWPEFAEGFEQSLRELCAKWAAPTDAQDE